MTKVLVLYYSSYGHIETMATAMAEGVREAGAEAVIKRVPELVPEDVAKSIHFKLDQAAPIATVDELPEYDAIIIGVPTRFGNMPAQMKNFLDQTGALWFQGKLIGKVGSVFASSATQHGGQESTILSIPCCCITAWSLSACPIPLRARWTIRLSPAAAPMVQPPLPMATVRASLPTTSWQAHASRASMWQPSPPS